MSGKMGLAVILVVAALLSVPVAIGGGALGVSVLLGGEAIACSTAGDADVVAEGKTNTQKAYNYLVSRGLQPFQAAAIVGNLIHESGGQTTDPSLPGYFAIYTNNPNKSSGANGIAHWLDGRLTNLKKHQFRGRPWTDIDFQLDFLWWELTEDAASTFDALKHLRRTRAIYEATVVFEARFERSGVTASYPIRAANAERVLERYGRNIAAPTAGTDLECTAGIGPGGKLTMPPGVGSPNSMGYVQMPESPKGVWLFDPGACPNQRYGKPELLAVLHTVANEWQELYPEGWVKIGDLNASGHLSHFWGVAVDLNAFTKPSTKAADMLNGPYDRQATIRLGKLFIRTGKILSIWYNDPVVNQALLEYASSLELEHQPTIMPQDNHEDHFHVNVTAKRGPTHGPGC